jgi:hypothetical protein
MAGLVGGIAWYFFWTAPRKPGRTRDGLVSFLSRPAMVPGLLFFLVQVLAGCLAAAAWLNLRLLFPDPLSKVHLLVWVIFVYLSTFGLLLVVLGREYFANLSGAGRLSLRGAAVLLFSRPAVILLLSFLSAVLIGLAADGLILDYLESLQSPHAGLNLFAILGAGLPFAVFDLILIVSAFFPNPAL